MKITAFDIERFGLWSGLKVPRLAPGINVFYGANEAGKSTVMEFIRAQLYGFGDQRRRYARKPTAAHVAWNSDVDHEGRSLFTISGGMMQMECPSGNYRLRRMYYPDRVGREEQIDLQTLDGDKQGSQLLRVLVSGVDEPTFNNVFAIGLDELQRLGSLSDTEAAEMLFRLSVGMDRVSIVDAIKELTSRRNRILNNAEKPTMNSQGRPSLLPRLLQQREKILEDIALSKVLLRDYVQIRSEQHGVERSIANLEEDIARLEREKRIYEIAKQSEPIWVRRDRVREEIDAMGPVTVVTEETVAELERLGRQLEKRQFAFEKLRDEYRKAQTAIKAQPVNETLWKLAPRIEVLLEEEKRIVEIDGKITELENEISTLEARVVTEEEQIKHGRRTVPIPTHLRNVVNTVPTYNSATEFDSNSSGGDSGGPTEHASFASTGAVISAPSTLSSASVSSKGYRPNVDMNDILKAEALEDYHSPARAVSKARKRLHRTKEQHADLAGRAKVLNEKIKLELAKRDYKDLAEAVEKTGETVTHLRRRQTIAQRLNEMTMHHKELHRINAFLVQHQALPSWALAFIGIACVGGAVPVGFSLFEAMGLYDGHMSPIAALLGLFLIAIAVTIYIISGKSNAQKLQHNQRQLSVLLSQIEHAKQEAAAIDARLQSNAVGSGSVEMRFQEAQQELAALEKLLPVDAQRREANAKLRQLEVRLQRSKDEYASATKRWGDWLRMAGLPNDWTPARIRDLMSHCDVVADLKKELDHRYDLMNQRIREMRNITDRIDKMIVETGLSFEDGMSYVDILGEIRKKLEANDVALKAREKIQNGIKEFRKMRKKAVSDLRRARQEQSDLLRQYVVKKPDELLELHRRHLQHRKFLQQEQAVQRELDAAIGGFCEETKIGELLEPRLRQQAEELEERTEEELYENGDTEAEELPALAELTKKVKGRIEAASAKLHDELELRGTLVEKLKKIAEDQTTIKKQRELAILDEKIEQARSEWQTQAVCARMLDTIRVTYERERQPRTLAEASTLLKRLTNDKYHRIWTPLGEETLLVDDADGNTFDVAWLSRGTREQLFIALRLALTSAFAQHGSILPIILDDVLVNFDSKRALAAARLFLEFAKSGRQIFLFTCHEHICRMFQKLDVPVRILPPVDEPGRPTRVLLPRSILRRREAVRKREAERLAREEARRQIDLEIADREEAIRREVLRKADVQRLILQMQQIATAEKAIEAEREGLQLPPLRTTEIEPPEEIEESEGVVQEETGEEEWWEDEEEPEDA